MKNDQDARYSVVELCWALGVSRSGLSDHEQKPDGERRREDDILAQKISLLFLTGRCTYGWRRIQKGFLREGIACGKKRIVRLMRDQERGFDASIPVLSQPQWLSLTIENGLNNRNSVCPLRSLIT